MKNKRLSQIIGFLREIEEFKTLYRKIILKDSRFESDAEHTWHMCMFALLLKDEMSSNLNLEKVFKLALIHDLPEIYAGDTYAFDEEGKKTKAEREEKAARELFSKLPEDLCKEMHELFVEYENLKSPEARFVKAIDKIQPILTTINADGLTWKENKADKDVVCNYGAEYIAFDDNLVSMHKKLLIEADSKDLFFKQ